MQQTCRHATTITNANEHHRETHPSQNRRRLQTTLAKQTPSRSRRHSKRQHCEAGAVNKRSHSPHPPLRRHEQEHAYHHDNQQLQGSYRYHKRRTQDIAITICSRRPPQTHRPTRNACNQLMTPIGNDERAHFACEVHQTNYYSNTKDPTSCVGLIRVD